MEEYFSPLNDEEIQIAKARIWKGMESKLPNRGLSMYQEEVRALRKEGAALEVSRLQRVRSKEQLLDLLPERTKHAIGFWFMPKRAAAFTTLGLFFSMVFLPLFQAMPVAMASRDNLLTVAQGKVFVNGVLAEEKMTVQEGDVIHTEPGSMAHLELQDDSRVSLAPNTEVELLLLESNPSNGADSRILINHKEGRLWSQVVNLVGESSFTVQFPDGQVSSQRASFDLQVSDELVELQVARNLVEVTVDLDQNYEGTLGQGGHMLVGEELLLGELSEEDKEDVWWDFNVAYGKDHVRRIDETYKNERIQRVNILPGNPLYKFKTFQESVQETFTFSKPAKERLVAKHAENRLAEAQTLVDLGREAEAEVLIEQALENAEDETVVALLDQSQKELLVDQKKSGEKNPLVQEKLEEKSKEKAPLTVSQKLDAIPDLVEDGELDLALQYLEDYQEKSLSILAGLEEIPLAEREEAIEELLEQKLKDLQKLRLIAGLLADSNVLEAEAQIYEEMSLMALGLREESLDNLTNFFVETEYDLAVQEEVYARVKDSVALSPELKEQFEQVEEELKETPTSSVVMDVKVVDERFEDLSPAQGEGLDLPHADEAEDEAEDSKEATSNPEAHNDL